MSQIVSGISAGITLATMPDDEMQYFLTYEDASVAVGFSRVMKLEMTAEGKVVSTPIEQGSFASYNKVESPVTISSQLAVEGEMSDLQSVVDTLFELKTNTETLNFVTPVREYEGFTLEKFSYQQAVENGINLLYVDITLMEIKEVEPQYTDTQAPAPITTKGAKNPANVSTQDKGKQQVKSEPPRSKLYDIKGGKIKKG